LIDQQQAGGTFLLFSHVRDQKKIKNELRCISRDGETYFYFYVQNIYVKKYWRKKLFVKLFQNCGNRVRGLDNKRQKDKEKRMKVKSWVTGETNE
jgi:hypothetical protein